jgi:subtilisin family serine protease
LLALFSVSEVNLQVTNVSALWDLGMRGQGIVVASMDTGVDVNHPDLSAQWRGGTNSWFDPNSQHPTIPTDTKGHGTWTMGIMVGQDASGIAVGVAPDARWIAVKIFDDRGMATVENIHKGFQWLLDPDETPGTPDAPHVVNNSWGYQAPGCNLEFQQDLRALRAAGILPVFAAGNAGPAASTSVSPANYPEAFAVGATNNSDLLYTYGSRGPSGCGQAAMIFPEVVAPGVSIYTTDLHGNYISVTGTSLAAAHVAGALALLLSADPGMTVAQQEAALIHTAVDLGSAGADNDYGHGRLDVLAAYQFRPPCPAFAAPPDVSVEDIQAVAAHWRRQSTDPGWDANFDLNQDGTMTTKDIMLAVARLGEACW